MIKGPWGYRGPDNTLATGVNGEVPISSCILAVLNYPRSICTQLKLKHTNNYFEKLDWKSEKKEISLKVMGYLVPLSPHCNKPLFSLVLFVSVLSLHTYTRILVNFHILANLNRRIKVD